MKQKSSRFEAEPSLRSGVHYKDVIMKLSLTSGFVFLYRPFFLLKMSEAKYEGGRISQSI